MIGSQARQSKSQQENADEKYEQDDKQTGSGCEATEYPIPGPADLGELDATRRPSLRVVGRRCRRPVSHHLGYG